MKASLERELSRSWVKHGGVLGIGVLKGAKAIRKDSETETMMGQRELAKHTNASIVSIEISDEKE